MNWESGRRESIAFDKLSTVADINDRFEGVGEVGGLRSILHPS